MEEYEYDARIPWPQTGVGIYATVGGGVTIGMLAGAAIGHYFGWDPFYSAAVGASVGTSIKYS